MTPTEQDNELREQLQSLSYRAVVSAYNTSEAWLVDYARELTEGLMQLIATHDQQLLEAILEGAEPNPTTPAGENEFVPVEHIKSVFKGRK